MDKGLPLADGLREFVEVFIPVQFRTADTRDAYERDVWQLVTFLEGKRVEIWQAVGLSDLQLFLLDQEQKPLSPSTRKRRVYAIKAFFRFLVAYNYISKLDNPAEALIPPQVLPKQRRFLLKHEYEALMAQVDDPRDRTIIEVFLQTGLTLREMSWLKLDDIQLPPTISPKPEHVGIISVMRKGRSVDILLNWKASRALYHWLVERQQVLKQQGILTPALWVSRNGGFLCPRAIRNVVKKYMEAAGIESVSPRSLRHTYATHFLVNGGNVKMVKKALGHQRIDTTNVYVELAERVKRATVQQAAL